MAKRRKKTTKSRRGRRVGAMALKADNPIVKYGSIAVGFLMAPTINGQIDKLVGTNIDGKIVAGGQAGLGALLAFRKGGGKMKLVTTIAGGILLGSGVKRAMSAFGIGGYQNVPAVNGYQNIPAVNGVLTPQLPGYDYAGGGRHLANRPAIGQTGGRMRA